MRLGEAPGTWLGVIGTNQCRLGSPRRGRWSKPRGDEVGMTKCDLALGTDRDRILLPKLNLCLDIDSNEIPASPMCLSHIHHTVTLAVTLAVTLTVTLARTLVILFPRILASSFNADFIMN